MLVALERNRVVGFAVVGPASDPDCDPIADGELLELTVDADERGKGHGSRLLTAAVDTMTADRFTRAVFWAIATDDELRAFLTSAGWARRHGPPRARPRRHRQHPGQAGAAAHRRLRREPGQDARTNARARAGSVRHGPSSGRERVSRR